MEPLNWSRMAKSLAQESELVEPLDRVDEDLVCFGAEGHVSAAWANLQVHDLVWVGDLGYGLCLVTVPEEDGTSGAGRDKLKFVVASLAHGCMETVLGLTHL